MRKLFVVMVFGVLSGCGDALDGVKARQSVIDVMGKDADVVVVPGRRFSFVARQPDGSVWYIETMNATNADVSGKTLLLKPAR